MWNVVSDDNYLNQNLIFPTQQKDVGALVRELSMHDDVNKIIIFGSSVTSACNPWSDIDIYAELSSERILHVPHFEVPVDLWTNFDVDERLLNEITEKGVLVYEK